MNQVDKPTAVQPKAAAETLNPFGVPLWKRPLYYATDCVETYLEGFERLRQRKSAVMKAVATSAMIGFCMAAIVIVNIRQLSLLPF
jgi:hypothetical protein